MLVIITAHFGRDLGARLGEDVENVLQTAARLILDAIHVLNLNELRKEICYILDSIRIMEIQLAHPALGQLVKQCPNGVIGRNIMPFLFYHAVTSLLR